MAAATELDGWLATKLADLRSTEPANNPGIMLGAAVWGPKYIDLLGRYCVPSLMAPANRAALKAMNARLLLVTTKADFISLWRVTKPIEDAGIRVQFDFAPKELLSGPDPSHKFQALGTLQNLMVQRAGWIGHGYHMLMPDHLYSERYFDSLAGMIASDDRIAQGAVAHGAVSANILTATLEIDRYRRGDGICIPARTLGDLGRRHLHQQTRAVLLHGKRQSNLPKSNVMLWFGRNAMHIAGPHGNPAWMSPRLCRNAPVVAPTTLDAELPHLMPDGFVIPGPDAEMVCVELSDGEKAAPEYGRPDDFISICWIQMNFDNVYLPVLRRRTLIPVEPIEDGLSDDEIDEQHNDLLDILVNGKVAAMERFLAYLCTVNRRLRRVL